MSNLSYSLFLIQWPIAARLKKELVKELIKKDIEYINYSIIWNSIVVRYMDGTIDWYNDYDQVR